MLKKFALMLALPLALVMSTLAVAQSNPPTPPPFAALGGQTAISASNASSRVALPASTSAFGAITVYNASTTVDAYVALGDVTVVALNSGGVCAAPTFTMCLVKAGTSIVIWASGNTYIAGITSSSTASLVIYQGSGGVQLSAIYSGTSPPSGPAGGDLSGTYPNPTVAKASGTFAVNGCTIGSNAVCAAGTGQMTGLGINGAPVTTSLISIYNSTPAERIELGINGSNIGLGLGSGGMTLWGPNASPGSYDTGFSRDSVIGAGNLDLGNGTANDKTGTLNAAKVVLGDGTKTTPSFGFANATGNGWYWRSGIGIGLAGNSGKETLQIGTSGGIATAGNSISVFAGGGGDLSVSGTNTLWTSSVAGAWQSGGLDAAAPVAQTLGVQNVVAGTANTIGQPWSLNGSQSTGTAGGGSVLIKTAGADVTHTVNTFTGSASPYTIGFTAGSITTYPIGTVMTVSGCTTATLNGTYTVTASSSGSVTATTSATGTGSPTTCLIVGNTSQNPEVTAVTIDSGGALTLNGATTTAFFNQLSAGTSTLNGSLAVGGSSGANAAVFLYRGSDNVNVEFPATLGMGWSPSGTGNATADTSLWRQGAGIVQVSNAQSANANGSLKFASYVAGGTAPVGSGTCTRGTQTGGLTAGSIVLTCTAQTLILTFTTTAPNGWMCEAIDQTTTADTMKQTSNTTTSCTLTGTTAASDVVIYQARAY